MKMFSSKKGVSPLVATVLLIGFAVGLGAVVMSYGSSYYGETGGVTTTVSQGNVCDNINLEVHKVSNIDQICYENGGIKVTLVNKANANIDKIRALVTGNDVYVTELGEIEPGYPKSEEISYDFGTYGDIKQIEFIPILGSNGAEQLCFDNSILKERIKGC
tara:strand:+ start:8253 stop:8735 length:483 start_codon:yes stop_codon:yes gene_type:complete